MAIDDDLDELHDRIDGQAYANWYRHDVLLKRIEALEAAVKRLDKMVVTGMEPVE